MMKKYLLYCMVVILRHSNAEFGMKEENSTMYSLLYLAFGTVYEQFSILNIFCSEVITNFVFKNVLKSLRMGFD